MSKINLYTTSTKESVSLPKEFGEKINMPLIAQAVHVYRNHLHKGRAVVQTRAEVNRTKAKVYAQKGTGNARHGAKSAPIFVGGGKAHGPRGERRVLELPKKMRALALASVLAYKAKKDQISLFNLEKAFTKTKEANKLVTEVRKGEGQENAKLLLVFSDKNKDAYKVFANIHRVNTVAYRELNAYLVFTSGKIVFDNEIFAKAEKTTKTVKKVKTTKTK